MSDVFHDNSHRVLVQISNSHPDLIPDYVMKYTLPDKEAASEIDDELFADQARRMFPMDNPASAWLSAAYLHKHAAEENLPLSDVEIRHVASVLEKAGEVYGIAGDIDAISSVFYVEEKEAEDTDEAYGWVMRHDKTGEVLGRKYPMFDKRGVKLASDYFAEYRNRYPAGVRRGIARRIMKRANDLGVDVDTLKSAVHKEAGYGLPRRDVLMSELLERAHLTKDAESAAALANINDLVAAMDAQEINENLNKIAEVIDTFDRQADLVKDYGRRILMPADFLYDIDIKEAEAVVEDSVELDKYVFSATKLAELPQNTFIPILGPEFGKAIVKEGSTEIDREKFIDTISGLKTEDRAALEDHLIATYS